MSDVRLPAGFTAHVANIGIKDQTDDFVVVASSVPCTSSAVFTRSRFAGPSVVLSRRNAAGGELRSAVVISKNANVATGEAGPATVVGVAKGVGMIEPNMATMIALVFTDAEVDHLTLDTVFRRVVERTFNSLSVDTDTSTSDTAAVMASGVAGPADAAVLEDALEQVCTDLTRQLAADGEGATKLLVVRVDGARDDAQAKRVAKAIVNSPLVKTAVHGADPNWGRVAMAVGKCEDDTDIDETAVVIRFGSQEVYPAAVDDAGLEALAAVMARDEVEISVSLGIAAGQWTVYGCDLSDGYVRINADYTT